MGYLGSERFALIVEQLSGAQENVVSGQGSVGSGTDDAVTIRVGAQKSGLKRSPEIGGWGRWGGWGATGAVGRCMLLTCWVDEPLDSVTVQHCYCSTLHYSQ